MTSTMAIDQYGNALHGLGEHPRKAILARLGSKHADRIFIDTKNGGRRHIGYIVQGRWFEIFSVSEWQGGAA